MSRLVLLSNVSVVVSSLCVCVWGGVCIYRLSCCEAKDIVAMATATDTCDLRKLWSKTAILSGVDEATNNFHLKVWSRYRYHRCAVLGKPWSGELWRSPVQDILLCSCLPFALTGRCEHEQYALTRLQGHLQGSLDVPGLHAVAKSHAGGRPLKDPKFNTRGLSSGAVFSQLPAPIVLPGDGTASLSDAHCALASHTHDKPCMAASELDHLWDILLVSGLQHHWQTLAVKHKLTPTRLAGYEDWQIARACDIPLVDAADLIKIARQSEREVKDNAVAMPSVDKAETTRSGHVRLKGHRWLVPRSASGKVHFAIPGHPLTPLCHSTSMKPFGDGASGGARTVDAVKQGRTLCDTCFEKLDTDSKSAVADALAARHGV